MIFDRRTALLGTLALGLAARAGAQTRPPATPDSPHMAAREPAETIDLWPKGAPGAPAVAAIRQGASEDRPTDRSFSTSAREWGPRLPSERCAVLIMPGGGYSLVVVAKKL